MAQTFSGIRLCVWMAGCLVATAAVAQTTAPAGVDSTGPFWKTGTMTGESVLFMTPETGGPSKASLLFYPLKILAVTSSDGKVVYKEGRDYLLRPGTRDLSLPAGSAIRARTMAELTPPLRSQPFGLLRRDGRGDILFGASHEYADMQTLVTYTFDRQHSFWNVPPPMFAERELPATIRTLRSGEPLKLVLFGDSISVGCNASKWADTAPFQPAYGELLANRLTRAYGSAVSFRNLSEGGRSSAWGVEHVAPVAAEKPDLVILAWGMNDSTGEKDTCPPDMFVANLEAQMAAVLKVQPKAEFILVASMLPNQEWWVAHPERVLAYRDAMRKLVRPGVALADVSAVWEAILTRKPHLDFTGNGVNHPNDFGHRLYADVLAALLIEKCAAK